MNATTSRPASTQKARDINLNPWNLLADLGRQQLTVANECASALFRGNEAMGKIQQDAAHQASEHLATAVKKLQGPCQAADLLAIQSELLRVNLQGVGQYWQQLAAAAQQTQIEMMTSASHMLDGDGDADGGVKSALEVFQAAIPPLASSFFVLRPSGSGEQPQASPPASE
ncbi:MAG: phasin family protein [Polaromonas sp.]